MRIENRKLIHASTAVVWQVTQTLERWPDWTPTIESVRNLSDGPLAVGSMFRIKQPGLPEADWQVTSLTPEKEFTWGTRVRGIRMVATHEMTTTDEGTESLLRIEIWGLLVTLLWPLIRRSVGRALETENAGLKSECEVLNAG